VDAAAEKFVRERKDWECRTAARMEAGSLPNQVQDLLGDLDSLAAPQRTTKRKAGGVDPLVNDASAQVKKIAEEDCRR